jgi:hypothetical protein
LCSAKNKNQGKSGHVASLFFSQSSPRGFSEVLSPFINRGNEFCLARLPHLLQVLAESSDNPGGLLDS